jgi:D-amino-acid dehydrogenase
VIRQPRRIGVVGAGIVGLSSAYYLRQLGLDVVVIDRGNEEDAASFGNAGMLMPIDSAPLPGPGVMNEVIGSMLRPDGPIHLSPLAIPALATWLIAFMWNCGEQSSMTVWSPTVLILKCTILSPCASSLANRLP